MDWDDDSDDDDDENDDDDDDDDNDNDAGVAWWESVWTTEKFYWSESLMVLRLQVERGRGFELCQPLIFLLMTTCFSQLFVCQGFW